MPLLVVVFTLAAVVAAIAVVACLFFAGTLVAMATGGPPVVGYLLGAVFVIAPVVWVIHGERQDSSDPI